LPQRRCLRIREEKGIGAEKGIGTPCAREKRRADWKKVLANLWRRKRITKKAHAGRGQEIKWEISN
jgi:hypothetical protein